MILMVWLACVPGTPKADGETPVDATHGVLMLAGGGSEGEVGEADAWSAGLYRALLERGDVTGDGRVRVVILSTAEESDWLPGYFVSLGADEAENWHLDSRAAAQATEWGEVDAAFLKGGDQGEYYDLWNETAVDEGLRSLHARGGGVGGTSAGAMSLAGQALAGGQDLTSDDVLVDSHTSYLDDSDGGSGIHDDFLGLLPGVLVDTHFTERSRLGRLIGAMAKAADQGAPADLLGLGLEQETGVLVREGRATVHGRGGVAFVRGGRFVREEGRPLLATEVVLDVLTEGGVFDLEAGQVQVRPDGAVEVVPEAPVASEAAEWAVDGDLAVHEERCGYVVERDPDPYAVRAGEGEELLQGAFCLTRAHESDERAPAYEALLAGLAERPGTVGFLVAWDSALERDESHPDRVRFSYNPSTSGDERATVVLDGSGLMWTSRSPMVSAYDQGDGSLVAAGLGPLVVHVLADTAGMGTAWDQAERSVLGW